MDLGLGVSDAEDANTTSFMSSSGSSLSCSCGRFFSQQSALTNHTRNCKLSKKRLASALDSAKEVWQRRKKKKQERRPEPVNPEAAMIIDEPNPPEVSFDQFALKHFGQLAFCLDRDGATRRYSTSSMRSSPRSWSKTGPTNGCNAQEIPR